MQSDEQLYELSAKELAESPRKGLLLKCMTKTEGDTNKAHALYISTRVKEMKKEIRTALKEQKYNEQLQEDKKLREEYPRWTKFWDDYFLRILFVLLTGAVLYAVYNLIVVTFQ